MAATGIKCDTQLVDKFNLFKMEKTVDQQVMFCKINDKVVDCEFIRPEKLFEGNNFDEFLGLLPPDDGRYIAAKVPYKTNDGRDAEKVAFITWIPDSLPVKKKMLYSGTKDEVKKTFSGVSLTIHATDLSEISKQVLINAATKI